MRLARGSYESGKLAKGAPELLVLAGMFRHC